MASRYSSLWFWLLLILLIAQNTLDMILLRMYTAPNAHETFPLLAHTLSHWGLDASIWTIRGLLYSYMLANLLIRRCIASSTPLLNDILLALNAVYLAGMWDELFFTGILHGPR